MPKVKPSPAPYSPAPANGSIPDVLTLAEAAAYLRLQEAEVVRLIGEQRLPARQVGSEWRFLLTAIRHWLGTGKPPVSNKEAWSKLVGVWKDDPTLEELRKEMKRQQRCLASEVEG
jgi:excisionase family DNA binding protein